MGILSDVLLAVDGMLTKEINEKTPKLELVVKETKLAIFTFMETIYISYLKPPRHCELEVRVSNLNVELTKLNDSADDLLKKNVVETNSELAANIATLKEHYNSFTTMHHNLFKVHVMLMDFDTNLEEQNFLQCETIIREVNTLITDLNSVVEFSEILDALIDARIIRQSELHRKLTNIFQSNIIILSKDGSQTKTLKIQKCNDTMKNAVQAFEIAHELDSIINLTLKQVLPRVVNKSLDIQIEESHDFNVMKIGEHKSSTITYKDAFDQFECYLTFLQQNLNYTLKGEANIFNHIAQLVSPSIWQQFEKLAVIAPLADVKQLEVFLRSSGVFNDTLKSTIDLKKAQLLKVSQVYFEQAEALMQTSLFDYKKIDSRFNECCVSQSAIYLIEICATILKKCAEISDRDANMILLSTTENILDRYSDVMMANAFMVKSPEGVALFYNNSCYLVHQVELLKKQYSCCKNLFSKLRLVNVGHNVLQDYVELQVVEIDEILRIGVGKRSVEFCLKLLDGLQAAWQKLLASNVYNKNMGFLLNYVCGVLIDAAGKLDVNEVKLLKVVVDRGVLLFKDLYVVLNCVPVWHKFNEIFV